MEKELLFLGHIVSDGGIKADPNKIKAINNMQRPTSVKQVRYFLGMVAYLRKYIKDCGKLTAPINDLTKGNAKRKFVWTPEHDKNFHALKQALIEAPILQYPNNNGCYELESDANDTAIGAVLRIRQPGQQDFLLVCYEIRKLTNTKQRYPIHDKEYSQFTTPAKSGDVTSKGISMSEC